MTNKEARDCLDRFYENGLTLTFSAEVREALLVAIKALGSDMIRRQDAVNAVCMDGCGLCKDVIEQIGKSED